MSFIAGMCGQIPSQSQIRKSMQENGNAVCGQRLVNFLTMGRKNALSCSLFFFKAFSFDNEVYRSYVVFVEIPA